MSGFPSISHRETHYLPSVHSRKFSRSHSKRHDRSKRHGKRHPDRELLRSGSHLHEKLLPALAIKPAPDGDKIFYCLGARTAIGINRACGLARSERRPHAFEYAASCDQSKKADDPHKCPIVSSARSRLTDELDAQAAQKEQQRKDHRSEPDD